MSPPAPTLLHCDACHVVLGGEVINTSTLVACPSCGASIQAEVFPAFFRQPPAATPPAEPLVSTEDAGCFFHPTKKAVVPCGQCGRFLCATCDLELSAGRHFCPQCLENGQRQHDGDLRRELEMDRVFYDKFALLLVAVPLLIPFFGWFMTLFTAPTAFALGIAAWSQPSRSLVPRTRMRVAFALLIATVLLAAWGVGLYYFCVNVLPKAFTSVAPPASSFRAV